MCVKTLNHFRFSSCNRLKFLYLRYVGIEHTDVCAHCMHSIYACKYVMYVLSSAMHVYNILCMYCMHVYNILCMYCMHIYNILCMYTIVCMCACTYIVEIVCMHMYCMYEIDRSLIFIVI